MKVAGETRSARKHREILKAGMAAFVSRGYDGTSMEEIATRAGVSKQTVYKHFADKERLFSEIVLSTTDRVEDVLTLVLGTLADTRDLRKDLQVLGRRFLSALMQPELLKLRRLVIANADRMPELGRAWYQNGFERVLAALATSFRRLTEKGLLRIDDPDHAASHFAGILLWIPVNEAMFTGNDKPKSAAELDRIADRAVLAFLAAYANDPPKKAKAIRK
jgi:TetR/AcrR family transcriptional regulator, mexJK operon transcriptional repressor